MDSWYKCYMRCSPFFSRSCSFFMQKFEFFSRSPFILSRCKNSILIWPAPSSWSSVSNATGSKQVWSIVFSSWTGKLPSVSRIGQKWRKMGGTRLARIRNVFLVFAWVTTDSFSSLKRFRLSRDTWETSHGKTRIL